MVVKKGEHLREKKTGKLYRVKRFEGDMVLIESKDSEEKLLVSRKDIKNKFTRLRRMPRPEGGDECEKGTRRSSCLPMNIFGGQVSVGGYATAGFAGAVKIPHAEARGGFTKTFATKLFNLTRIIIFCICITFALLGFFFLYLMSRARGDAFEAHAMMAMIFFHLAVILFLSFYGGVWIYKGIIWMRKKL